MRHFEVDIWDGFEYTSETENFRPKLTVYLRDSKKPRGFVLILPGGGYGFTSEREAEPIALKYVSAGYHAAFLDYSVAPDRHPKPLQDALRSLSIMMENQSDWQINPDQIFVVGFSAGGHLAATVSNYLHKKQFHREGISLNDLSLAGAVLAYPVISSDNVFAHTGSFKNLLGPDATEEELMEVSMEKHVHYMTPPTFLWHTVADASVPVKNSMEYSMALKESGVPFELHVYPDGGHGLSIATEEVADGPEGVNPHVAGWMALSVKWMKHVTAQNKS